MAICQYFFKNYLNHIGAVGNHFARQALNSNVMRMEIFFEHGHGN